MTKSNSSNVIRIVLFVALLAILGLKAFDLSARSKTQKIYTAISEMLNANESGAVTTINQAKIHELFGKPVEGYSSGDKKWTDVYRNRGVFRSHSALVEYSDRVDKLVIGVSTK